MSRGIQFNEDQIAEFQEAFLLYDNRGDGKIPVSLIGDVMRALGQNPTESEVKKLVHEHRADERVTFEVFLPILQAICSRRSSDTTEDFVEGLRHFDKDGNGSISSAELRHLLTTLGERLNDEEVIFFFINPDFFCVLHFREIFLAKQFQNFDLVFDIIEG